jgi:hypothetical protein
MHESLIKKILFSFFELKKDHFFQHTIDFHLVIDKIKI